MTGPVSYWAYLALDEILAAQRPRSDEQRFAGATYDPTSHYRGARVLRFSSGLTLAAMPTSLR
jgi:hypothetical protein